MYVVVAVGRIEAARFRRARFCLLCILQFAIFAFNHLSVTLKYEFLKLKCDV